MGNSTSKQATREAGKQTSNALLAQELANDGFKIFPCDPETKRPMPGVKWRDTATAERKLVKRWWKRWPDAMPGLPTGDANGLSVVDLDQRPDKDGLTAYREKGLDPEAASVVSQTAGGGLHLYFAHEPGVTNSASKAGLDIRGEGGYVIAPGATAKNGKYTLRHGNLAIGRMLGLDPFPAGLRAPEKSKTSDQPSPGDYDLGTVRDALNNLPNDGTHDDWTETLMAVHHATRGSQDGLALAAGWSAGYPGFSFKELQVKWRSFGKHNGAPITVDTLFAKARQNGWQATSLDDFDDLEDRDDLEIETMLEPVSQPLDDEALALLGETSEPVFDYGGLTFTTPAECVETNPRPYVVKGLLAERDMACIVGAPGVGKSLLAPRLAYAVAQGEALFDLRTKQGGVFYVAAEDEHGMKGRLRALHDDLGDAPNLHLVGGVSDLLTTESVQVKGKSRQRNQTAAKLARAVRDHKPSLIVIDTLAMAFPGLDENSAEGMGRVVALARSLTKWGAAVVMVHHDTKDGMQGLPRGHSLLNGALDLSIHLKKTDSGVVKARLTKNRNGSCDLDMAFKIKAQAIGTDEDGDTITAAVCEPCAGWHEEARLSKPQNAALNHLVDLVDEIGESVPEKDWRDASVEGRAVSGSEKVDTRRTAFRRAAAELIRLGKVTFSEGRYRLGNSMMDDFDDVND